MERHSFFVWPEFDRHMTLARILLASVSLVQSFGCRDEHGGNVDASVSPPTNRTDVPASAPSARAAPLSLPVSSSVAPVAGTPAPTDQAWDVAPEAENAAEPASAPKACSLKHLREWVRVKCGPGYSEPTWMTPGGQLGKDYFTHSEAHFAELVVRTGAGQIQRATIDKPGAHEWLQIVWPTSKPSAVVYLESGLHQTNLFAPLDPVSLPDLGFGSADRPADADWISAPEVNMAPENHRAPACSVRVLSAWAKLICVRRTASFSDYPPVFGALQGFGTQGVDYFISIWAGSYSTIEFRLQRGHTQRAELHWDGSPGALEAIWPEDSSKPTLIAARVP